MSAKDGSAEPQNESDKSVGGIRAEGRERRIPAERSKLRYDSDGVGIFVLHGFPHAAMEAHVYCCLLCGPLIGRNPTVFAMRTRNGFRLDQNVLVSQSAINALSHY